MEFELYHGKKPDHFYVYFRGTDNGKYIRAANLKSAKWIFAIEQGLKGIDYIAGKFWRRF